MNGDIIEHLIILAEYYKTTGDGWRYRAYRNAARSIRDLQFEIRSQKDLENIKGVGKGIAGKIWELKTSGKIDKVETVVKADTRVSSLKALEKIWGVGPVKAKKLFESGFTSVESLKKYGSKGVLTRQQEIGLKYYDDLLLKIKREYIASYEAAMRYVLIKKFGRDTFTLEIAGSFRRKKPSSGDIDVLVTSTVFDLKEMVETLRDCSVGTGLPRGCSLVSDVLSMKDTKFMGIGKCAFSDHHAFRLDIEFVPLKEWYSALLYFTGSAQNNVRMRIAAKEQGMTLSEHGLFIGESRLDLNSEEEYFEILGFDYLMPEER